MNVPGLSSALSALQRGSAAMDRAAERIARGGLTDAAAVAPDDASTVVAPDELAGPLVDAAMAKALFMAAVRMAESANENIATVLSLGGYGGEA